MKPHTNLPKRFITRIATTTRWGKEKLESLRSKPNAKKISFSCLPLMNDIIISEYNSKWNLNLYDFVQDCAESYILSLFMNRLLHYIFSENEHNENINEK